MKLFIASVSAWALASASASALTPTLASYYPPAKTSPSSTSFNRHTQTSEVSELLKMPQSHQTNYTRRVNTVQTSPLSHLSPDCDRTLCFALSSFSQAVSSRLVSSRQTGRQTYRQAEAQSLPPLPLYLASLFLVPHPAMSGRLLYSLLLVWEDRNWHCHETTASWIAQNFHNLNPNLNLNSNLNENNSDNNNKNDSIKFTCIQTSSSSNSFSQLSFFWSHSWPFK